MFLDFILNQFIWQILILYHFFSFIFICLLQLFFHKTRDNRSIYCQKCVCANSSNLFSDKMFPKFGFQSLLGLLLTNSIFLSLLFFGVTMKNVKAKIKKIQILSSRAYHSKVVILLIHHICLYWLKSKISGNIELNPGPIQK